jgi:hypothetical protein
MGERLRWVGFADRSAGVLDDVVLGLLDKIEAYQFKRSNAPSAIGLQRLFLGSGNAIKKIAEAYLDLCRQDSGLPVYVHYVTNELASTNDTLIKGDPLSTTANFIHDWKLAPGRSLKEWLKTKWSPVVKDLLVQSGLSETVFQVFWSSLNLVLGPEADLILAPAIDTERQTQVDDLSNAIGKLVGDNQKKDRWSAVELLEALGWRNRFHTRFTHTFEIGRYVQRNQATEAELSAAIALHSSGYISLVGPPGAGKSTLLQRAIRAKVDSHIIRYLAFVPGVAQGQGRAEADSFLDDLIAQLASSGLHPLRYKDHSTTGRQHSFENLLVAAGKRYEEAGEKTIIIVDGLDHVPREENPERSFLALLPLPQSIPDGVLFILGTQRLELDDIPASVRECAGASTRTIKIAPLSFGAVSVMINSMGLSGSVSGDDVYSATAGHPLVTHYLLERLRSAPEDQHQTILENEPTFSGDLDEFYRAAWRSVDGAESNNEIKKTLFFLAHVEGLIEPELLAILTSDQAVEASLIGAGHLLDRSQQGWRVFHNSFRLFLRQKPILRFGTPDPAYTTAKVYGLLAKATLEAGPKSPQRWLEFRYWFLSGELEAASKISSRAYFVHQYCEGRAAEAVEGDIADSFLAMRTRSDPAKLFELLLCSDEIRRREQIVEDTNSLSDAYLELGDIDAAEAVIKRGFKEGEQWRVVDALLIENQVERARRIFEENGLGECFGRNGHGLTRADMAVVSGWAQNAVRFLDLDQIQSEIIEATTRRQNNDFPVNPGVEEDFVGPCMLEVALAHARANPETDLVEVRVAYGLDLDCDCFLTLEAACAAYSQKNVELAVSHAQNLFGLKWSEQFDQYSMWKAARLFILLKLNDEARTIATRISIRGFRELEEAHRLSDAPGVADELFRVVSLRVACGLPVPMLAKPQARLLRGLQHHILELASAIGFIRCGGPADSLGIRRIWSSAIQFLAGARTEHGEDWQVSHQMQACGKVVARGIFRLVEVAGSDVGEPARLVDDLSKKDSTFFKWWSSFRRFFAVETFGLNGEAALAAHRLEAAFADCYETNPTSRTQETVDFALAFARVGAFEHAQRLLTELKRNAIGIWMPAKKDGIYETWASVLRLANAIDPDNRGSRGPIALRLLSMLTHGEGYDMASRVCREILFEAATASPSHAWNAANFGATSRHIGWDSVLDSILRSVVFRQPSLVEASIIIWSRFCLPWYSQPHASSVSAGQFLDDAFVTVSPDQTDRLERYIIHSVRSVGRSDTRRRLLDVLRKAAEKMGGGNQATQALLELPEDDKATADREDKHTSKKVMSLTEVSALLEALVNASGSSAFLAGQRYLDLPYDLRVDAEMAIGAANWKDAAALFERFPILGKESKTAFALLECAFRSSDIASARKLLIEVVEPVAKGWSWGSGKDRRRYHEWRNRLGIDADETACSADFADDMARSNYAASAAICEVDEIFPILFKSPPWPKMWELLAGQLTEWGEFQKAVLPTQKVSVETDEELLAELVVWAIGLGIPVLASEAARAVSELLKASFTSIFFRVIELSLERGDETALWAMDILIKNHDEQEVAERFTPNLSTLVTHPDLGIAASASYLGFLWQVQTKAPRKLLPAVYKVHWPDESLIPVGAVADKQTRGLLLDEPMAWTTGFESYVTQLADAVGAPDHVVRWRAGHLINGWGGVEAFGHKGTKVLEAKLDDLGLKLDYRRPQAEAALRALRYVAGDFWQAGLLPARSFQELLRLLRVHPERPLLPMWEARPSYVTVFEPETIWGHNGPKWLDGLTAGLTVNRTLEGVGWVLGNFYSAVFRRSRTVATEDFCSWAIEDDIEPDFDWDRYLSSLPLVVWLAGPVPLYEREEMHQSFCAIFEPRVMCEDLNSLIVFCPHAAHRLGWVAAKGSVHIYLDKLGDEMARTSFWRDGLPQSIEDDEAVLEGQSVILSDQGRAQFENVFGRPVHRGTIWRGIKQESRAAPSEFRVASVTQIPWINWGSNNADPIV